MKKLPEGMMYVAFGSMPSLFAYFGVRSLMHFRAHPEALPMRQAVAELPMFVASRQVQALGLLVGLLLVAFLANGAPRRLKWSVAAIWLSWMLPSLLPSTDFRSFARLYTDVVVPLGQMMVACFCMVGLLLARDESSSEEPHVAG